MEKAMAPHSSTLAWKVPWMEEPGGLPSMGSHRVGHDWSDLAAAAAANKQKKCFPGGSVVEKPLASAKDAGDKSSVPESRKIPWRRKGQPTPVFVPSKSHGQRSLAGYNPWGHKESDMAEYVCFQVCAYTHTHTHTSKGNELAGGTYRVAYIFSTGRYHSNSLNSSLVVKVTKFSVILK